MINLHERISPTSAGVEPATFQPAISWSPVGRRIQLSHRGTNSGIVNKLIRHDIQSSRQQEFGHSKNRNKMPLTDQSENRFKLLWNYCTQANPCMHAVWSVTMHITQPLAMPDLLFT